MGQLQKVSWRTVGYAALGTVFAAASVVAIINSDGVRPTSLTSSAATRWLFDQLSGNAVLVDGLAGRVVAKVDAESPGSSEVAVQGVGGAFLVAQAQGSVRAISTAKLSLGTAQPVSALLDPDAKFGVGASGLTVVSGPGGKANVVAVGDVVARPVTVPKSTDAYVASDGSMWLLTDTKATHVNVDESTTDVQMRSPATQATTVGAHGVAYDNFRGIVRWLGGSDISVQQSIPNPSDAVLQQAGDDARCVWLGVDNKLICVGPTKIERTVTVAGMHLSGGSGDKLAVAGDAAVIIRSHNEVARIDLENRRMANDPEVPTVPSGAAPLTITASGNLIWLDDEAGSKAWVVHRFGINTIHKDDANAPLLDAQGQVKPNGDGGNGPTTGNGNAAGQDNTDHNDNNGHEDPPHATDDSVTSRAGVTVTIPVTGNDWDPDEFDPIAVSKVGADAGKSAASGTVDILDGNSVTYVPNSGFSGVDSFNYTIVDSAGETSTATVTVELFPPGSPNQPPLAQPDQAFTRVGQPITIDVLANDIDPERDTLAVAPFRQDPNISDATGPSNLPALKYDPPAFAGIYKFAYQAVDPQGGTSEKTTVTVTVSARDAENSPPVANPDAIRLRVGVESNLDVKANDTDPNGDDLRISVPDQQQNGVTVRLKGQQLFITLLPAALDRVIVHYILTDKDPTRPVTGNVLVLRIGDTAPNRPPVANPDADRVVIGSSVKIPVTANDLDPEKDVIRLLSAVDPVDGSGTTTVEGNSVRFTPNLPDIKEPTPVTFTYKISDGHGHEAIGTVIVTVLLEALPKAPSARDDFADTETDKPVTINVLANDTDPSGGGLPHLTTNPVCAGGGDAERTPDEQVTFTPPAGQTGTFKCKYTVSNSQGFRAEASIIITVTEPKQGNRPPTLLDVAAQQQATLGRTLVLDANGLADDPDGDSLVFSAVSKPSHGQTNFTGQTSTLTYTAPSAGSADQTPDADNFEVTISDGNDGNVHGTISIKLIDDTPVPATPVPPKTHDIAFSATTGVNLPFDVVAELHDDNIGDTLTLISASADSGPGTAQVVNGVINIVPAAAGTLIVNYTVQNSAGESKSDKITVTIIDPPQTTPPLAVDDSLTVSSGGVGSVDLLANDSGLSDPGDNVSVTLNNRPPASFGSVDLNNNGVLSFVAAAGADGQQVSLTYTLKDGSGLQDTAQVTIIVLACSESPPQALDASIFTPYQTPLDINLGLYIVSGNLQPGSVRGAGLTGLTGTYTPPAGMNGTESVTFVVENGCHQTDQGQLTIDVNHSPLGGTIDRNMSGGQQPPLILLVNDLASDDEPLTITGLAGNPAWATCVPDSNVACATVQIEPPTGTASGTYTFTATVQDPGLLTAVATINITISNTPPTAVADDYPNVRDSFFTFNPTLNDFDSEAGQLCVQAISVISPPETKIFSPDPLDPSPPPCTTVVTVSPLAHGVSTLSYTIRDAGGLTSSSTITITSNNPPTIDPASVATEGQPTVDMPLNITDLDGDSLRIVCDAPPEFVVVVRATGSQPPADPTHPGFELDIRVSPTFNDPPLPGDPPHSVSFTCTVSDGLAAATATMTVTQS